MSTAARGRVVQLLALGGLFLAAATACTDIAQARLARRILEDHRARAKVKPLAAAQMIRIRLSPVSGEGSGAEVLEWDEGNYRETISSAGWTTVHGIQGGKGFFTDEDRLTRVASEPLLSSLITRYYFWKRGYLFDDQERARVALGPADDATVSVRLTPRGGDPLLLTFGRRDLALICARSKHFEITFTSPVRFRDSSRREVSVDGDILWSGLPTGPLPDTTVGGGSAHWPETPAQAEAAFTRAGRAVTFSARISGRPATLALDAAQDGPMRIRAAMADSLGLTYARDVFGRMVARGARLEIGRLSFPSLVVERGDSFSEGIDGVVGAALFRETVVEADPAAALLRFHDPARWVSREGFFRVLLDDDGNRPVAILRRNGEMVRLLCPSAIAAPICLTPESAARLGLSGQAEVSGLFWGAHLPSLPLLISGGTETDLGEDGRLGWDLVLHFHAFFDMPHRWAYLQPVT